MEPCRPRRRRQRSSLPDTRRPSVSRRPRPAPVSSSDKAYSSKRSHSIARTGSSMARASHGRRIATERWALDACRAHASAKVSTRSRSPPATAMAPRRTPRHRSGWPAAMQRAVRPSQAPAPTSGRSRARRWCWTEPARAMRTATRSGTHGRSSAPRSRPWCCRTRTPQPRRSFRLTVSDGLNAPVSDDIVVTVANVAPVVAITAPITGQLFAAGNVAAAASFTDPGLEDEHTCRINWDVDAPTLVDFGVVNESTRTCTASRALGAGVYTIVVSVDDGDGGVGAAQVQVIVYDPAAGFVTGGGWIQSPPGAAAAAPTASGRANFGFELRYKRGAAVPAGQTEFAFKTGGIDFHSTSYDWLVVVGSKAQFQGSGTVNGVAGYSFLATVVDGKIAGSASAFRIRIWNASGVVYDSVPGAPDDLDRASPASLGGGSVVIHN